MYISLCKELTPWFVLKSKTILLFDPLLVYTINKITFIVNFDLYKAWELVFANLII